MTRPASLVIAMFDGQWTELALASNHLDPTRGTPCDSKQRFSVCHCW